MKKLVQIIMVSSSLGFSTAFAGVTGEDKAKNNTSYTSPDEELKFSVDKDKRQVKLQVVLANLKAYDNVVIEKSSTLTGEYTEFKTISCADQIKYGGAAILEADKKTGKDVFYRVKTITKDGIARMYAPLEVAAAEE